ncbi:MAG: hypothetical protein LC114_24585 [Bryobacterales bacterium]|nr:hypothetical protein [Bryobacterales bacterium]
MKYIILALQLFPAILAAVKAIEANVSLPKAGTEKLELVTGVVEEAYTSINEGVKEDFSRETVTKLVVGIVARVVAIFNRLGIFSTAAA